MSSSSVSTRYLSAIAMIGLITLAGCGTNEPAAAPSPATSTSSTPTPPTTTTPSPSSTAPSVQPTTPAAAADVTVEVTIAGNKVSASQPVVKAKAGQKVLIKATSDVSESLHVHGYDKTLDLKPGKPASLVLMTGQKGLFEVETHESGKLVFKLQVS